MRALLSKAVGFLEGFHQSGREEARWFRLCLASTGVCGLDPQIHHLNLGERLFRDSSRKPKERVAATKTVVKALQRRTRRS